MKKTTQYKNVSWSVSRRKWIGAVTYKKVRYECGAFDDEIEAVKNVDRKIIALGLDYSKLQILKPAKLERTNTPTD